VLIGLAELDSCILDLDLTPILKSEVPGLRSRIMDVYNWKSNQLELLHEHMVLWNIAYTKY